MNFLDKLKNLFLYFGKYKSHPEAVIVACYYNPTNNPYRLIAFNKFYESIKHLNHRIVECVIGDSEAQLPKSEFISTVSTNTTLWHKEALLNGLISKLPSNFKYVLWVDADVIFTNRNWMVDAVAELQPSKNRMVQLFEYCVHLDQDEFEPSFNFEWHKADVANPKLRHEKLWRSFGANYVTTDYSDDLNYDRHGHVGFAWGARRSVLEAMPLYDKALIGGADHIMAHAAAGHIDHNCIRKSFTDDIDAINEWSEDFRRVIGGRLGYVKGDLYHIWHGDVAKRQYLKRIQDFTATAKEITEKDENGLYVTKKDQYVKEYMQHRENTTDEYPVVDMSFRDLYPEVQRRYNVLPDRIAKNSTYGAKVIQPKKKEVHVMKKKQKAKPEPTKKQIEAKRTELRNQYPNESDSFIESLLIGYLTDSTLIGGMVGGNLMGAAIGDMLNNNDQGFDGGFGGGDLSGGGAGGSWEDDKNSENFS
jgi:hypothetical protein